MSTLPTLREEIVRELIEMYVAPNRRSTVEECVLGKAEYQGTVRINASAIPLFRNIDSSLDRYSAGILEVVENLIEEHDPRGADANPAYWGKTLRAAVKQALTTKGEEV